MYRFKMRIDIRVCAYICDHFRNDNMLVCISREGSPVPFQRDCPVVFPSKRDLRDVDSRIIVLLLP